MKPILIYLTKRGEIRKQALYFEDSVSNITLASSAIPYPFNSLTNGITSVYTTYPNEAYFILDIQNAGISIINQVFPKHYDNRFFYFKEDVHAGFGSYNSLNEVESYYFTNSLNIDFNTLLPAYFHLENTPVSIFYKEFTI